MRAGLILLSSACACSAGSIWGWEEIEYSVPHENLYQYFWEFMSVQCSKSRKNPYQVLQVTCFNEIEGLYNILLSHGTKLYESIIITWYQAIRKHHHHMVPSYTKKSHVLMKLRACITYYHMVPSYTKNCFFFVVTLLLVLLTRNNTDDNKLMIIL